MKQLSLLSILFIFILLLLVPNTATALLDEKTAKIPYQVNNSDRIVIGRVSGIETHPTYTVYTITVKEWIYKPFPAKVIKVRTWTGTSFWTEDEAEFTLNESALLMLKDENLNEKLFRVSIGFPGKHPVSDRDAVIEELKAQGKWQEDQTDNGTKETGTVENIGTEGQQEESQTENKTNDTKIIENTGTVNEQKESSNQTRKSNTTPFMSPVCVIAAMLGAVIYLRRKQ